MAASDAGDPLLLSLLTQWTGLELSGRGPETTRWIRERAAALGESSAQRYVEACARSSSDESARLLDRITVHYSWFYRDGQQIDLVTEILREQPAAGAPIDVWVPGCAGGEDAYTVAMAAALCGRSVRVLGSDINPNVIRYAMRGRYPADATRSLPSELRQYLRQDGDFCEIAPEIRRSTSFAVHNLLTPPPLPTASLASAGAGWHIILCRNVLLYFTPEHVRGTLARMSGALARGGYLFLGAGEFLLQPPELEHVQRGGRWIHVRPSPAPGPRAAAATSQPGLPAIPIGAVPTTPSVSPSSGPHAAETPAVAAPPGPPLPELLRIAVQRLEAGDAEAALSAIAPVLQRGPVNEETLLLVGMAEHMRGQFARAVTALRGALNMAPDLWPALFFLALCHEALGEQAEAQRAYEEVARLRNRRRRDSGPIVTLLNIDTLRAELLSFAERHVRTPPRQR
jgi:chemotaxis methyl-accepting protein methylase